MTLHPRPRWGRPIAIVFGMCLTRIGGGGERLELVDVGVLSQHDACQPLPTYMELAVSVLQRMPSGPLNQPVALAAANAVATKKCSLSDLGQGFFNTILVPRSHKKFRNTDFHNPGPMATPFVG